MVTAILCPIGTIQYLPVRTVTSRTKKHSRNCSFSEISRLSLLLPHKILSLRSFFNFSPEVKRRGGYDLERSLILHRISASVGNEVALQEPNVETKQANGEGGVSDDSSEGGKSLELVHYHKANLLLQRLLKLQGSQNELALSGGMRIHK